jgi:hypothetical protein
VNATERLDPIVKWCRSHTSIIIGAGLMLASSGLDGRYMSLWMPDAPALGFILNTAADATGLYLGQQLARFMRSSDGIKRVVGLIVLALGQAVAVWYSWYFGYLQLRRVMPAFEPVEFDEIARTAAWFIPITLAVLGFSDGLGAFSSKRFGLTQETEPVPEPVQAEPVPLACPDCGATHGKSGLPFLTVDAVSGHRGHCPNKGNGHKLERERILG